MSEVKHRLNWDSSGCTCQEWGCKKWKEQIVTPGKEKRCPNCYSRLSLKQDEYGRSEYWCFLCASNLS